MIVPLYIVTLKLEHAFYIKASHIYKFREGTSVQLLTTPSIDNIKLGSNYGIEDRIVFMVLCPLCLLLCRAVWLFCTLKEDNSSTTEEGATSERMANCYAIWASV